ncbi:MAG TPA: MFS transporter [Saprospiraceae bacterium]|nr:MFS transporter [Saprospiraceae bacterium]
MHARVIQLYRNSFAGLNFNSWLLALLQLINRAGTMVVPFMSMYMTQSIGVSITKAGFVMACFGGGSILGAYIGGKLTDRFGFYDLMMYSLLFGGLSFIGMSFLENYYLICIGTFIMSVINESFRPASMAAISAYSSPETRTRAGSLVRLSVNLGWAFGAAVGGWIASYNYHLLFWVDGITNMLAAGFVYYKLPRITAAATAVKESVSKSVRNGLSAFQDHYYLMFILLTTLFGICFFQVFTTLPIYLKKELLLSESQIGWVMGLNGLLIAAFEMVVVYSLENKNRLQLIALGTFITGLSFVLFNILTMDGLALGMTSSVVITIGEILAMPFMLSFFMRRSTPENIGQYASLYTMAYSIAHIVGSYSGSAIADHFSFRTLWWSVGLLSSLVAVAFLIMERQEHRYPVRHEQTA